MRVAGRAVDNAHGSARAPASRDTVRAARAARRFRFRLAPGPATPHTFERGRLRAALFHPSSSSRVCAGTLPGIVSPLLSPVVPLRRHSATNASTMSAAIPFPISAKYAAAHASPKGVGDARPTALQIVADAGALNN